jgi:hypothetical protein
VNACLNCFRAIPVNREFCGPTCERVHLTDNVRAPGREFVDDIQEDTARVSLAPGCCRVRNLQNND